MALTAIGVVPQWRRGSWLKQLPNRNFDVSFWNQANKPYLHLFFLLTELFTESCSCGAYALREESYTHRCVLPPNPSFTPFSAGGRHVSEVSWHRDIVYHSCLPPPPLYLPIWNSSRSSALKYSQHFLPCFVHFSSCVSHSVSFFILSFLFCPFLPSEVQYPVFSGSP